MNPAADSTFAVPRTSPPLPRTQADRIAAIYRLEPWVAAVGLVMAAPVILGAAAVIAVLCRRTPLVRHVRVGWQGAELGVLKLRTMWEPKQAPGRLWAIEEVSSAVPADKSAGDGRVTSRFAAWCRRYSIDELPQLYHVLRGEMSLVGPRPITRRELDEHYGSCTETVLSVRPGLTGLWQVKGRNRLSYAQRRRLDVWLARHASPAVYGMILVRSVGAVVRGRDAF